MRTSKETKSALYPHVFNEIDQLVRIIDRTPCDQTWANARVESIAVHVRCLLDFFRHPADNHIREDDILATHYGFPAADAMKDLGSLRKLADKDIAHLTYSRIERYTGGQSSLELRDMTCVLKCCHEFAEHIIADGLDEHQSWPDLAGRITCLLSRPYKGSGAQ